MRVARLPEVYLVVLLLASIAWGQSDSASSSFRVIESKMQYRLLPDSNLELPIESHAATPISAQLRLELLQQDDTVLTSSDLAITIAPGEHVLVIPWKTAGSHSVSDLYWYRLRYRITSDPSRDAGAQEGIVQLGRIIVDLFRIEVAGLKYPRRGSAFPLRVRVDDPRTGKGQSGVEIQAQLHANNDEKGDPAAVRSRTDNHGEAVLIMQVPSTAGVEPVIEVTAHRGSWTDSRSVELRLDDRMTCTLSTDKPIYQPGQTLHLRTLILGANKRVSANLPVKITIEDDDGSEQFVHQATTSAFGIAQADWEIPERAPLGNYRLRVRTEEDTLASATVRISRYELPEFTVIPAPDHPFYLPGQQPRVEVKANYLFGQPVMHGRVRIFRENGNRWERKKQEEQDEDNEAAHGDLDSAGRFSAVLDVADDFKELRASDYQRYRDLRFAAYVTDLSTNRTEQKHFLIRLSKEGIHLYVIPVTHSTKEPLEGYITAALPDGTPASVDVVVSAIKDDDSDNDSDQTLALKRLLRVHTNSYGVARFRIASPSSEPLEDYYSRPNRLELLLEAHDRQGSRAAHRESLWFGDEDYIRVTPLATLLRAEENIVLNIDSSLSDQTIFVDLLGSGAVLGSRRIQLRHGHSGVEFPWSDQFRKGLTVVAYTMNSTDGENNVAGAAQVLYPEPQDLELGVHLSRTSYKPGEAAAAQFNIRSPQGKPVQSALGVVIYDKGVAERVRSDEEFGTYGFSIYDDDGSTIAGVSYRDLLNRKLTGPVPPDLELLAQTILATGYNTSGYEVFVEGDDRYYLPAGDVFGKAVRSAFGPVEDVMRKEPACGAFPQNPAQLREYLAKKGIDFDRLRDPLGVPYSVAFSTEGSNRVLTFTSSGPDKLPGTKDDFVASTIVFGYFTCTGLNINSALGDYFRRTGRYIRDFSTLAQELARSGVDLNAMRDPWGHPYIYKFGVLGPSYTIDVESAGPDGRPGTPDDIKEWFAGIQYFRTETSALDIALADHFRATGTFPATEKELLPVLQMAGLTPESLTDPWGHSYHFIFRQATVYGNQVKINSYAVYGGDQQRKTDVVPVTQNLGYIDVKSYGPRNNPVDQFKVASFARVISEQSSKDPAPQKAAASQVPMAGVTGAISGTVTDPQGAVVSGAKVTAMDLSTGAIFTAVTDSAGSYVLRNLPAGRYKIEIQAMGFITNVVDAVPVTSSNVTQVDAKLAVGAATETVEVSAEPVAVATTTMASVVEQKGSAHIQAEHQAFTPRIRKYFPETLLWRPELVTDRSGRAELKFQMADNITTWKMSVIASTTEGELGASEKELRTFQPFFLDHDPPKVLTQGDQIELPVVLRNYLKKPQEVAVKLDPSNWFSTLSSSQQEVKVAAGQEAVARFSIVADHSTHEGKERVTAANHQTGDAVERTVRVHPDGEDVTQTVAAVLARGQNSLTLNIPANAIPGSIDAELKIYPALGAHILESLNGMVARPAGCGEQITSIAFGSLVVLQVLRKAGQDDPDSPGNPNAALAKQARKYVMDGYRQLSDLQAGNGGFPYWAGHEADDALTAYVLNFLSQAAEFISITPETMTRAEDYLISLQQTDGGWEFTRYGRANHSSDPNLTAMIARVLAGGIAGNTRSQLPAAFQRAMKYLEARIAEWKDAYLVSQYALAASVSKRAEYIPKAIDLLRQLAHSEGPGTYWNLEANTTPFYGWGYAGRLETTGLAVQALAGLVAGGDHEDSQLMERGLLYLLDHKDRYGVWYSTQATVNVLRGILAAMPAFPTSQHAGGPAEILVNGKPAGTIDLPASSELSGPRVAEISTLLQPGENRIEIRRQNDDSPMHAQIISTHYIRWSDSSASNHESIKSGESRALRLNVGFDSLKGEAGKSLKCTVDAERIGFQGYGMMLAEIGLPPGADVDRQSLQAALEDFNVSSYEVLPDRVVVYLWPKAGGTKFSFKFTPRFSMKAATAPSVLYDYYNPEAHATVAPARFEVRESK